jgi:hypothetical protein
MVGVGKLPDGNEQKLEVRGRLTLSSVKKVEVEGHPHRWIEISAIVGPTGKEDQRITRVVKLLIPENRLKRGEDPFAHVQKMYLAKSEGTEKPSAANLRVEEINATEKIADNYTRRQYELDRFRSIFPRPLKDAKMERERIEIKLGRFACEKLVGTSEMPKGTPLNSGAEWGWSGQFECLLSDQIPFGVAVLRSQTKGYETSGGRRSRIVLEMKNTLTAEETGGDARSELPESW